LIKKRDGRACLKDGINKLGFTLQPGFRNFALIDIGGSERSAKICSLLAKDKIIIKGRFREACMRPYIRVGLGPVDQIMYLVEKLAVGLKISAAGS